jgi:hypothetical protein
MILRLSTFASTTGAATLSTVFGIADLKHVGLVVLFFFVNLLAYEFILCGVGAVVIMPFCREKSRFSEELCELVLDNCFRVFFVAIAILMFLWCCDIFRLIPVPG